MSGERHTLVEFDATLNRLTVNAKQRHLQEVLNAISEASGLAFIDLSAISCDIVDVQFDSLGWREAMSKLLGERSYILVEDDESSRLTVWLLPRGNGERLVETDILEDEFYQGLRGNKLSDALADQIRMLE
jgi:hypothetical protein